MARPAASLRRAAEQALVTFRRLRAGRKAAIACAGAAALAASFLWLPQGRELAAPSDPGALGRSLMAAGEYRRAAETLRAAWRADPSETLRVDLARALLAMGDYAGVLEVAESTEAASEDFAQLRAEALLRAGRYEEARALAQSLFATSRSDGRALLMAARAHYGLGDETTARELLQAALRAGGSALADAWLLRARMAFDEADVAAAKGALSRASELGAPAELVALMQGELRLWEGEFDNALEYIRKTTNKQSISSQFLISRISAARGDYVNAARLLRRISPYHAAEPHGALVAALIHEGAGDVAQAEAEYRRGLDTAPNDWRLLDGLAGFLARMDRQEDAEGALKQLEAARPATGAMRRAALSAKAGDPDGMLAAARAVGGECPPSTAAIAFGGQSLAAREEEAWRRLPCALARAAAALERDERDGLSEAARSLDDFAGEPAADALAADLLIAAGEDEHALARAERALAAAPDMAAARLARLRIGLRNGALAAAEERLRADHAADPEDSFARTALARLVRLDGRLAEAVELLKPAARDLAKSPSEAALFGALLAEAGEMEDLAGFAGMVRRAAPAASLAAELLARAGRPEEAASAARESMLAAPGDPARVERYLAYMQAAGREAEATAFLEALRKRLPRRAAAPAGTIPEEPAGIEMARQAFFLAPTDSQGAYRWGTALAEQGRNDEAFRVLREACFWSARARCPDGPES